MENFYSSFTNRSVSTRAEQDTDDFQEEDVWATMNAREISSITNTEKHFSSGSNSSSPSPRRFTGATARTIPRATAGGGAFRQSSAPVNIPDAWSKTLKKKPCRNLSDEEKSDEDMVPPHEYLARRLARTQIASFSMCEGAGRTLKGRDVTKFRNDILSKTGFLE